MSTPVFAITEIQDIYTRQNFINLKSYFDNLGVSNTPTPTATPDATVATPVIATTKLIKAVNYQVLSTDRQIFLDCTNSPITVTLPSTSAFGQNALWLQKIDTSAHAVTINVGNKNSEFIRTVKTASLPLQWESLLLRCFNSTWYF